MTWQAVPTASRGIFGRALTIAVRDAQHLEQIIEGLAELGDTTTGVVVSEPVHPRDVDIAAWTPRTDEASA